MATTDQSVSGNVSVATAVGITRPRMPRATRRETCRTCATPRSQMRRLLLVALVEPRSNAIALGIGALPHREELAHLALGLAIGLHAVPVVDPLDFLALAWCELDAGRDDGADDL